MERIRLCPLLSKNLMALNNIKLEVLILQMNKTYYYLVNIYFYLTLVLRGE